MKLSISQNELSKANNAALVTGSEGDAIKFAIRKIDFLDVQQGKLPPKKWESLRRDLRTLSKQPRVVPLLKELVEFDGL